MSALEQHNWKAVALCGSQRDRDIGGQADTVWLAGRPSEANLKTLSRDGKLARYRVLHFATHGLLAAGTSTRKPR
jgi:hypothetical protein